MQLQLDMTTSDALTPDELRRLSVLGWEVQGEHVTEGVPRYTLRYAHGDRAVETMHAAAWRAELADLERPRPAPTHCDVWTYTVDGSYWVLHHDCGAKTRVRRKADALPPARVRCKEAR